MIETRCAYCGCPLGQDFSTKSNADYWDELTTYCDDCLFEEEVIEGLENKKREA